MESLQKLTSQKLGGDKCLPERENRVPGSREAFLSGTKNNQGFYLLVCFLGFLFVHFEKTDSPTIAQNGLALIKAALAVLKPMSTLPQSLEDY